MNRDKTSSSFSSRLASGGALFAEVGNHLVAGHGLYPTPQVVIAAVEHFVRLRELIEVSLDDILHSLVGGSGSVLRGGS